MNRQALAGIHGPAAVPAATPPAEVAITTHDGLKKQDTELTFKQKAGGSCARNPGTLGSPLTVEHLSVSWRSGVGPSA